MGKNEELAAATAAATMATVTVTTAAATMATVTATTAAATMATATAMAILLLLMSMIAGIFLINDLASGAAAPVDPHFFLLEDLQVLLILLGILITWIVSLVVVILADALTETMINTFLLISTLSLVPALVTLTNSMTGTTPILRRTS